MFILSMAQSSVFCKLAAHSLYVMLCVTEDSGRKQDITCKFVLSIVCIHLCVVWRYHRHILLPRVLDGLHSA